MSGNCQVCGVVCDDACVRCERPTCDEHFFEQVHYGVCIPCVDEIDAAAAERGGITNWPYPLRTPIPGAPVR